MIWSRGTHGRGTFRMCTPQGGSQQYYSVYSPTNAHYFLFLWECLADIMKLLCFDSCQLDGWVFDESVLLLWISLSCPWLLNITCSSQVRPHRVRPVRWQIKDCQTTEPRNFDSGFSGKVNLSTLGFNGTPTYLLTTQCVPYYLVRGYPLYVRPSLTLPL